MELNLLVKAPQLTDRPSINVEGKQWCLANVLDTNEPAKLPEYTCISYSWGAGRVPNPFDDSRAMSVQTFPALIAAIRNTSANAFWIDALCVPPRFPQRRATLESMGFIYSRASQVVVVLSTNSFGAVEQMTRSDRLDEESLQILNQDVWIKSVWTYQEVVNSQLLIFVSGGSSGGIVDVSDFLNCVGYSLELYKKKYSLNSFDIRDRFPGLDALEDVITDWMISSYQQRSALQVLSNMDRRSWSDAFNYFYAMMGAVTDQRSTSTGVTSIANLADTFMRICEEKNDYSFIYSSADRDERTGMRWRPAATILHSVLPLHSWGEAQRAHHDSEGLWLEEMVTLVLSQTLGGHAQQKLRDWLLLPEATGLTDDALAERMYSILSRMGFTGEDACLITVDGFFFPQTAIPEHVDTVMLISAGISWILGAPGILQVSDKDRFSYIPGVFAGVIEKDKASAVLIGRTLFGRMNG